MRALAVAPNVVCNLSGLGNTVPKWTEDSIRPYVLEAIDIFGIDRCMFASNFPDRRRFQHHARSLGGVPLHSESLRRRGARQAVRSQRDPTLSPCYLINFHLMA
jgi:predicted TIM-barrel fold metal-dependent hydrolase